MTNEEKYKDEILKHARMPSLMISTLNIFNLVLI